MKKASWFRIVRSVKIQLNHRKMVAGDERFYKQYTGLLEMVLDSSHHAVMVTNLAGNILYHNRNLPRIVQLPDDAFKNQGWQEALSGQMKDPQRLLRSVNQILAQPLGETLDIFELKDGRLLECRTRFECITGAAGAFRVWCFIDCTEQQRRERELTHLGLHDTLTGSYNRAFFEVRLRQLCLANMYPVCMFMIDVDGLKKINDQHGHPAGDHLLCQVVGILQQACRTDDVVARLGGDEFGLLLVHSDRDTAEQVFCRVQGLLNLYNIRHAAVPISISIGYAIANNPKEMKNLVARADEAMYEQRRLRRSSLKTAQ